MAPGLGWDEPQILTTTLTPTLHISSPHQDSSEIGAYEGELERPDAARPKLHRGGRLPFTRRQLDFDTIPPALALNGRNDQDQSPVTIKCVIIARTAGLRQNRSSFCAVAIWA